MAQFVPIVATPPTSPIKSPASPPTSHAPRNSWKQQRRQQDQQQQPLRLTSAALRAFDLECDPEVAGNQDSSRRLLDVAAQLKGNNDNDNKINNNKNNHNNNNNHINDERGGPVLVEGRNEHSRPCGRFLLACTTPPPPPQRLSAGPAIMAEHWQRPDWPIGQDMLPSPVSIYRGGPAERPYHRRRRLFPGREHMSEYDRVAGLMRERARQGAGGGSERACFRTMDLDGFTRGDGESSSSPTSAPNEDGGGTGHVTPLQKRVSGLPDDLVGYHVVNGLAEMGRFLAGASYVVSLGGKPLDDLRYGIVIVPEGEERLLFKRRGADGEEGEGEGEEKAGLGELEAEVLAKSRAFRRSEELQAEREAQQEYGEEEEDDEDEGEDEDSMGTEQGRLYRSTKSGPGRPGPVAPELDRDYPLRQFDESVETMAARVLGMILSAPAGRARELVDSARAELHCAPSASAQILAEAVISRALALLEGAAATAGAGAGAGSCWGMARGPLEERLSVIRGGIVAAGPVTNGSSLPAHETAIFELPTPDLAPYVRAAAAADEEDEPMSDHSDGSAGYESEFEMEDDEYGGGGVKGAEEGGWRREWRDRLSESARRMRADLAGLG